MDSQKPIRTPCETFRQFGSDLHSPLDTLAAFYRPLLGWRRRRQVHPPQVWRVNLRANGDRPKAESRRPQKNGFSAGVHPERRRRAVMTAARRTNPFYSNPPTNRSPCAACLTIQSNLFDFSEITYKNCFHIQVPSQIGICPGPRFIEKRAHDHFNHMKEVTL